MSGERAAVGKGTVMVVSGNFCAVRAHAHFPYLGVKNIKCHSAVYCGRDCQIQDFNSGHKKDCKLLKVLRERYRSSNPIPDHDYLGAHMSLQSFLYTKLKDAVIPSVQEKVSEGVKQRYPDMANVKATKSVSEEELINFI